MTQHVDAAQQRFNQFSEEEKAIYVQIHNSLAHLKGRLELPARESFAAKFKKATLQREGILPADDQLVTDICTLSLAGKL